MTEKSVKKIDPSVAVVIVNWNKKDYVLALLKSLEGIGYGSLEVFVIDNASDDDSVEAIGKKYPSVEVVVNEENLGGTGGFNSGLRHVLARGGFEYTWLLDNDASIREDTLEELVKVMEEDSNVGIAGSRILDLDENDVTLEVGASFRWDTVGVTPNYRNTRNFTDTEVVETDYVAICSALVRNDSLDRVGLMDEKLFLFWDDMDWGLYFLEKGYKVVAVPKSIALHGSFTERDRGVLNGTYYGVRNPLLVYSKHTGPLTRLRIFYNYFRYFCKGMVFILLNDGLQDTKIALSALRDFCNNKWGRCNFKVREYPLKKEIITLDEIPENPKKILIMAGDVKAKIMTLKGKVRTAFPDAELTVFLPEDRVDYFKDGFDKMFILDPHRSNSLLYNIQIFFKLLFSAYDICFTPVLSHSSCASPFSYALKKTYFYVAAKQLFTKSDISRFQVYKLVLATVIGELASLIVTPIMYFQSFKYSKPHQTR